MKAPEGAHWYDVPAGSRPSECRAQSCRATIYWAETRNGKKVPVDCDVDGGSEPTAQDDGRGVSHFQTCPEAEKFSR